VAWYLVNHKDNFTFNDDDDDDNNNNNNNNMEEVTGG